MTKKVLITGGAGFIASHLADELLAHGYAVKALDNLSPQVHGHAARRPSYLDNDVELHTGDVRDRQAVIKALEGVDAVFHFAAAVGVGQSMYRIAEYTEVNNMGTAVLLECLSAHPVQKLVVASSMSIYGEGLYKTPDGRLLENAERTLEDIKAGFWEPRTAAGQPLTPVPTPEGKRPNLASVYALSKYDQEVMCLMVGKAYGIPATALRFFNVYGPRQALSNPYTGVLTIFASRLLNGNPPIVYEDGMQQRDFVSVHDVARACRLALESEEAGGMAFNIGSGTPQSIIATAGKLSALIGRPGLGPQITGKYRMGDIRHCFADISLAKEKLGYNPVVSFEHGMTELAQWLEGAAALDKLEEAQQELAERGLVV
ncbi:MAG: NAD-dependent epimerase/dehydratase family protein [Actinomycetota bacterium]|nr:NAD-dependent epimerase/dehydratase family protein [Actinomycetota bacterium]